MIDAVGSISVDAKNARECECVCVCTCLCIWLGHICVSPEAHNVQCDFRWILDPPPLNMQRGRFTSFSRSRAGGRPSHSVGYLAVIWSRAAVLEDLQRNIGFCLPLREY